MSNFDEIKQFLAEYRIIEHPEREQNFFEIARFPHYENVFSNMLAFFLEKSNLVLQSLLDCVEPKHNEVIGDETVHSAKREIMTAKGNRIDIVVTTSKRVIGIENKVGAALYNDLGDYGAHLEKIAGGLPVLKIVLSKNRQSKLPEDWHNITHQELARQWKLHYYELQRQLKDYRLFLLFNEFVDNIDFLNGGYMDECKKFFELLQDDENSQKIESILVEAGKAKDIIDTYFLRICNDTSSTETPFSHKGYWNATEEGGDRFTRAVVFKGFFMGHGIKLDVYVSPMGLSIAIKEHDNKPINDPKFWETIGEIVENPTEMSKTEQWPKQSKPISFEQYDTFKAELLALLGRFNDYAKSHGKASHKEG